MTSRTIKLLSASTAFVAAAAVAPAYAAPLIVTSSTTPIQTSATAGGIQVGTIGSINVPGTPAIEISSTTGADNIISVSTGGIIKSGGATQTSATIRSTNTANAAVIINNSGTIAGVSGTAKAIDLSGMTNGNTILNVGTISGSVTLGDGTNLVSSTGTITGALTGGTGGDTLTLNGGTVNGAVNLSDGTNVVTINGGTIAVTTGAVYTGGSGADTMTVTNGVVSGTMDFGGGTDNLYISGTTPFTTKGAITQLENLGVSNTTLNLAHSLGADVATIGIASNATISSSVNQTASGVVTNNGTLNVNAGTFTAGTWTFGTGSNLGLTIANSSTVASIASGNAVDLSNVSLTINVGANAGFIASGTQLRIVDGGTGAATLQGNLLASNTGVYRFSTVAGASNQDISLTIGRISTSSVVDSQAGKAIANALDTLGANASGTLYTVQGLIGAQSTAAGVNNVVASLAPAIDGAGAASIDVGVATGNQVSNRLASLRSSTGMSTGDAMANSHMWLQGFGSHVDQDNKNGNYGYEANSGGASIGLDSDNWYNGYTTGVAFSYGRSTVDSKSTNNGSTDIDSYIGTVYGSRVLDQGMFVNGQVSLGYNNYDTDRTVLGIGQAKGSTHGWQASAKVEGGRDFAMDALTLTPMAGLQYSYLDIDSYTETGAGGASLHVKPKSMGALDASAGVNAAYAVPLADGGTFTPSAHAKYIYRMGDTQMATTSQFTGGGAAFNTQGVKADRSSVNLGASLLWATVAGTDLSLNYDADIRSNLTGHTGQLKARWAF